MQRWTSLSTGFLVLALSQLFGSTTFADDKVACAKGLALVRDKTGKLGHDAAPPKVTKVLRVAVREQREGEFDEWLDALENAKRILPK